jgi:hypothetical protein
MRLRILSITVVIFTLLTSFFFCTNVINPIEKYENVSAALKANRFLWKIGVPDSFSVHLFAPNLVDSIVIDFGENGQDTAFIRPSDPNHPTDSFSVAHTYSIAGFKPIWARAYLKNGEIEQSDTLSINVGAQPNAPLGITMTDTPKIGQMFYIPASATGSDTLRYQWFKNGSAVVGGYAANLLLQSLSAWSPMPGARTQPASIHLHSRVRKIMRRNLVCTSQAARSRSTKRWQSP